MMKKKDAVVKRDEKKCKNLQKREKQSSPQPDSRENFTKDLIVRNLVLRGNIYLHQTGIRGRFRIRKNEGI